MRKGIITLDYAGRLVDRIAVTMYKMRLYKTDGYYPIIEDKTGKEVAAFVFVYGNDLIVRLLERITDYRATKNSKKVNIYY